MGTHTSFGDTAATFKQSNVTGCQNVLIKPLSTLEGKEIIAFLLIVYLILAFSSALLNSMTLFIFFKSSQMKGTRNVKFQLSLAASSLLVGIYVAPIKMTTLLARSVSTETLIIFGRISDSTNLVMFTTLVIMCTIILEQYLKITRLDVYYKLLTSCRFNILLALPWIIFLILSIAVNFIYKVSSLTTFIMVTWVIVLIAIPILYWKIHAHLKKREKLWHGGESLRILVAIKKQNKKSRRMMMYIIITIFICYTAGALTMVVHAVTCLIGLPWLQRWKSKGLGIATVILLQSNAIVYPMLYHSRSNEFSKALRKIIVNSPFQCLLRLCTSGKNPKRCSTTNITSSTVVSYPRDIQEKLPE